MTASAARPSAARSCDSSSASPSSALSRRPETALSRMSSRCVAWSSLRALIERQLHSRRRKSMPAGQREKTLQALPLPRAQVKLQVVAEIRQAIRLGNADRRGRVPGNLLQPSDARRRGRRPSASPTPDRSTPGRAIHMANTNGKPVHRDHSSPKSHTNSKAPLAGQHAPVADQHHRVGRRVVQPKRRSATAESRAQRRTAPSAGSAPARRWCASLRRAPACGCRSTGTRL